MMYNSLTCVEECPEWTYKNNTMCYELCDQETIDGSLRYFDKETQQCEVCNQAITGCNHCSYNKDGQLLCNECDDGLFLTFDYLECTPCSELW